MRVIDSYIHVPLYYIYKHSQNQYYRKLFNFDNTNQDISYNMVLPPIETINFVSDVIILEL